MQVSLKQRQAIMKVSAFAFLILFLANIQEGLSGPPSGRRIVFWVVMLMGFAVAVGEATKLKRLARDHTENGHSPK